MKKIILLVALLISTSSFAFPLDQGYPVTIKGMTYDELGITFQVPGSCVGKEAFRIDQLETNPPQFILKRVNLIDCRLYNPYGIRLRYSWDELGLRPGQSFFLNNEIEDLIRVYR